MSMSKSGFLLLTIAFLVSLIFGGSHLFLLAKLSADYSPILLNPRLHSITADETVAYAPKIREIMDGNFILTDVYLKEWKKLPSPLISENLPAALMAVLAKASGSLGGGFIAGDFVFPALNFLALSFLLFLFIKNWAFSSFISLVVIFFSGYLKFFPYLPSIFSMIFSRPFAGGISEFHRSFHPQVSFLIFVSFTLLLFLAIKKSRPLLWSITGSLGGLLVYTYPYYSMFVFSFSFVYLSWLLVKKKSADFKKSLFFYGALLFVSLPFAVNQLAFWQLPRAKEYLADFQYPVIFPWKEIIYSSALLLLVNFLKGKKERLFFRLFFLAVLTILIFSYLLKININNTPGHLALRIIYPYAMVLTAVFLYQHWRILRSKILWWALSFLLVFYQGLNHHRYFANNMFSYKLPAAEKEVFNWLNNLTPKETVVVTASLKYNLLVPALTHNNVFLPYSQYSLASEKEAFERFYLVNKFFAVEPERLKEMFTQSPVNAQAARNRQPSYDDCGGGFFYYCKYKKGHNYLCYVSPERLKEIISDYKNFKLDENKPFGKFEADYLLVGPYEKKWSKVVLNKYPLLKLMEQNQDYQLYQINSQ